ncbi:type 1 fimbrial protein [Serratia microhaemolytica]|uniref:type 1 fimbrial protein n=1 Tax=Serratia microhaemolytica TaxID=2675110 RepID=UPI000FDE8EEB|nr:type 1 fimbrial protein [Serratia microhaemolytica]
MKKSNYLMSVLCCMATLLPVGELTAADSQLITFNISVVAGSCTMTSSKKAITINDSTFSANPGNWGLLASSSLSISLSSCSGSTSGLTVGPVLTLSLAPGTTTLASSNNKLFRDSKSTSTGFGIGIYKTATTSAGETNLVPNNGTIALGSNGVSWSSLQKTYTYAVGVLCASNCTSIVPTGGSLSASVIFTFTYK